MARTSRSPHKFPKWTPLLDHAQEDAMPWVEWALTPMGHCKPKEEDTRVIASTNHLEIICFVTGLPLVRLPKPTKCCSDFLYEAKCSMHTLRALMGQSRDNSWLPVEGESAESAMTWALNGVESTIWRFSTAWYGTVRYGTVHFWGVFHWVLYLVPDTFLVPLRSRFHRAVPLPKRDV